MKFHRVAVVGAGPAGMYAVQHLLENRNYDVEIDLYERLPVPWGLIRYGVAPDHQDKKRITDRLFSQYLISPKVRFFGNVEIGKALSIDDLAAHYDATILTVGASAAKTLDIPGENLPGVFSARSFVNWYNGHPDFNELPVDLSGKRAIIVGNGNVALDVARILVTPLDILEKTDIANHALDTLRMSKIEEITLLGRRSVAESAFHSSALEEFFTLSDVDIAIEGADLSTLPRVETKSVQRKLETLNALEQRQVQSPRKRVCFRYQSVPIEVIGDKSAKALRVISSGLDLQSVESDIPADLVIRSIGYEGEPIEGLPFDEQRGVIPSEQGRVIENSRVYVAGWIRRGPTGIIGTNKKCAKQAVDSVFADWRKLGDSRAASTDVIARLHQERGLNPVSESGWAAIDLAEQRAGLAGSRPRIKLTYRADLLAAVGK